MATKKGHDAVSAVIEEVEALAKRLRNDVRKAASATGIDRQLRQAAGRLRKQAGRAAQQVEKYAHQLRIELQGKPAKKPRARARKRAA